MKPSVFIAAVLQCLCGGLLLGADTPASRPNIIIFNADDETLNEFPILRRQEYRHAQRRSAGFRRHAVSQGLCEHVDVRALPRAELYTGLYPMHSGVCWNHMPTQPGTKSIVQRLAPLSYRVGLAGKIHATPKAVYPFEMVDGFERNCVAQTADYECNEIKEFMTRDATKPFCLVVASVLPHAPWTVGDWKHFKQDKFVLPPYMVDTPQTRESLAHYYGEYEALDRQLGDVMATLKETGKSDNTIVLFTSEQGGQWPGCKWTNWETGLHTALIVRWPGHVAPGSSTNALVQYADVLPTLLEAVGGDAAAGQFDGSSFLSVLNDSSKSHRKYAYAMHNNLPEGPPYSIRSITDGHFHYLRNLSPDSLYISKWVMASSDGPYWTSWLWKTDVDPHAVQIVERYMHRPAEQLYDVEKDPYEMTNVAADPEACLKAKAGLSAEISIVGSARKKTLALLRSRGRCA